MKWTIFKRLAFGYGAIMVLLVFLGAYVTFKLTQVNHLSRLSSTDSATMRQVEQFMEDLLSQESFEKKFLISDDRDFAAKFWEIDSFLRKQIAEMGRLMNTPENREIHSQIGRLYDLYVSFFEKRVPMSKKARADSQEEYEQNKALVLREINHKLRQMMEAARKGRDEKEAASNEIVAQGRKVAAVTAALAVLLGLLISFYNTRSINRSISLLQRHTREIAKGRFDLISDIASPPEVRELADDFNLMCERLKELDEMKVDFISYVSHELRTPLTAIREATGMLLDRTYSADGEKGRELLEITKEECERLIGSVNRILDLSCMEAQMMEYRFAPSNLFTLIQRTVLKLAPIARNKEIDLELEPPPDLPPVAMDDQKIALVLENLLGNAFKFTARHGRVVISTSVKEGERKLIEVAVSDSGCGILEEDLKKIFEKFKKIEDGRKAGGGTGLGLSIAKHVVAAHGGEIWAESRPGEGSTFFFTLPLS